MYTLVQSAEPEEVFEFLRDLYQVSDAHQPIGGRWTQSLVREELKIAKLLAHRDCYGYLRSLLLFRDQAGELEVSILGTAPAHRRRGLMTQLLERLVELGKTSQKPVWVDVHCKNEPAIHMYTSRGFEISGSRPRYYADGGDALLMSWNPKA